MRRATKFLICWQTACAVAAFPLIHADIVDATSRGKGRDVVDVGLNGYEFGIDIHVHAPGDAGFLEAWYRTPISENSIPLGRIYGAAALPGRPAPHPAGSQRTPAPTPTSKPWVPWMEPPTDA
jgi:hypothetical protein